MLNPIAGKTFASLVADGLLPASPTVIEIGNQTYAVGRAMEGRILATLEGLPEGRRKGLDLASLRALAGTEAATATKLRETGASLDAVLDADKVKESSATVRFFKALGFASYDAIDMNSRYGSLVMDLNKDLASAYGFDKRYDLVTNNGTSEHIADQASVLRNMHALTESGGLMVHILPFTGFVNHGFFNYQPILFEDLAAANGYELLRLAMADRDGVSWDLLDPSDANVHFYEFLELAMPSERHGSFVVAVLRKREDRPFVLPVQGKYLGDIESQDVKATYAAQSYRRRPTKGLFFAEKTARSGSLGFRLKRKTKTFLLRSLRKASHLILTRLWKKL